MSTQSNTSEQITVALRDEIAKAIPDIVKLLKDKSDTVRIATSTVLSNLVDNSRQAVDHKICSNPSQ